MLHRYLTKLHAKTYCLCYTQWQMPFKKHKRRQREEEGENRKGTHKLQTHNVQINSQTAPGQARRLPALHSTANTVAQTQEREKRGEGGEGERERKRRRAGRAKPLRWQRAKRAPCTPCRAAGEEGKREEGGTGEERERRKKRTSIFTRNAGHTAKLQNCGRQLRQHFKGWNARGRRGDNDCSQSSCDRARSKTSCWRRF